MEPSAKVLEIREHYHEVACGAQSGCSVSRGCGQPLTQADLQPGETVLDLGCGGGAEVIEAARAVGPSGFVFGLDMTPEMLNVAHATIAEAYIDNASFIEGYLEDIPLEDALIDVIISNCVVNLCDDKAVALQEAYRVLKPGGRLVIADIVAVKPEVPAAQCDLAADLLGCTNGVLLREDYESLLATIGFLSAAVEPFKTYSAEDIRFKALTKNRENDLSSLDEQLIDHLLASAYVLGRK